MTKKGEVKSTYDGVGKPKLTEKQRAFCLKYIETGNASEAYRTTYNAENMSIDTIKVKASNLLNRDNVRITIDELRAEHKQRHNITVDVLLDELEEARQKALSAKSPQTAAAVAATMGKAKILGLDKQVVDITTNGKALMPTEIIVNFTDEKSD